MWRAAASAPSPTRSHRAGGTGPRPHWRSSAPESAEHQPNPDQVSPRHWIYTRRTMSNARDTSHCLRTGARKRFPRPEQAGGDRRKLHGHGSQSWPRAAREPCARCCCPPSPGQASGGVGAPASAGRHSCSALKRPTGDGRQQHPCNSSVAVLLLDTVARRAECMTDSVTLVTITGTRITGTSSTTGTRSTTCTGIHVDLPIYRSSL